MCGIFFEEGKIYQDSLKTEKIHEIGDGKIIISIFEKEKCLFFENLSVLHHSQAKIQN